MRSNNEFLHLNDNFEKWEQMQDEEVELVLLPPGNMDGAKDKEVENYPEVSKVCLDSIQKVSGKIQLCTSQKNPQSWEKEIEACQDGKEL